MTDFNLTINETTIGIAGSSGTVCGVTAMGDVLCNMKIPKHWIFSTEDGGMPYWPVGKCGLEVDLEQCKSPRAIMYWLGSDETIGWYGCTTNMETLVSQFKDMGAWLKSPEAKAEFYELYEQDFEVLEAPTCDPSKDPEGPCTYGFYPPDDSEDDRENWESLSRAMAGW